MSAPLAAGFAKLKQEVSGLDNTVSDTTGKLDDLYEIATASDYVQQKAS